MNKEKQIEILKGILPDTDDSLIEHHISNLDTSYFEIFSIDAIARHLKIINSLSSDNPVDILATEKERGLVECTIIAYDYPSEFSLLTGILAGSGFNILSGNIFTYKRRSSAGTTSHMRRYNPARRHIQLHSYSRRYIIDHFCGYLKDNRDLNVWLNTLKSNLYTVVCLLEQKTDSATYHAKRIVNEMVTRYLRDIDENEFSLLYPVEIHIDNFCPAFTRLKVISQDTPAFLYSLSNALSLQNLSIEHVAIRTILGRIEDVIDITDLNGKPVTDKKQLNHLRFSILLTKQFTYCLSNAPDPFTALSRFEQLVTNIIKMPEGDKWMNMLANPDVMHELAAVLGASDFLWEDFIRLQYENLLPVFQPNLLPRYLNRSAEDLEHELNDKLSETTDYALQKKIVNEFKDKEYFFADLEQILSTNKDIRPFAEKLTSIAEIIVKTAAEIVFNKLTAKFGEPETSNGTKAVYAIFGLGKLGGAALGYASDIELLFIYNEDGKTNGEKIISNAEFFSEMVEKITHFIESKREGIFDIDLRLRPHGNSGPKGVSLEAFCKYYGPGGQAHSFEKLALVRLRAFAGDKQLGRKVERLRDKFIYSASAINLNELKELRHKQLKEKTEHGLYNAKFSPGGLVDIEYTVQILQILSGQKKPELRTPLINKALRELKNSGILTPEEQEKLNEAYDFLRNLINGLRMLRGSAKDLFLPPFNSHEFIHLARRSGYTSKGNLQSEQQLLVDFERHTAIARNFVERHLGQQQAEDKNVYNIADLLITENPSVNIKTRVISLYGFKYVERAYTNLKNMAGKGIKKEIFIKLAILACDMLSKEPDPDMALNNWERFIHNLPSAEEHYKLLFSQPNRLQILLGIFSRSQFFSDVLIRNPDFFNIITSGDTFSHTPEKQQLADDLKTWEYNCDSHEAWLSLLRRFKKREFLRIGVKDICFNFPLHNIIGELSSLADVIIEVALRHILVDLIEELDINYTADELCRHICIFAFGKLGGNELNYSSDIDLMGMFLPEGMDIPYPKIEILFKKVMERLYKDIASYTEEGNVFRVDLRLRPYGSSGELIYPVDEIKNYYAKTASVWELQALLKLRCIAGNIQVGNNVREALMNSIIIRFSKDEILTNIRELRTQTIKKYLVRSIASQNIKNCEGGIRDIEFLVQSIQLIHLKSYPELFTGNTLKAISLLREYSLLPEDVCAKLSENYIFLRRVEHYLQILQDCRIHALPTDKEELNILAKKIFGRKDANHIMFTDKIAECLSQVSTLYRQYVKT